jgi:hypothetical protein
MEVTDPTLNQEHTIELRMPDAELFDHLGLDESERYTTSEAYLHFEGHDPYDLDTDYSEVDEDDVQTPPDPDEYTKCDHCGATDRGSIGQSVKPRGTSLLTAPARPEYLCPECYAQVVSQYIGLELYQALITVLLSEHKRVWKIAQYHGKGIEGAETVEEIAIDVLAEWKTAYEAADEIDEGGIKGEHLSDRERRFLELFPALGVGQPGFEFDSPPDTDTISFSDVL